MPDAYEYRLPGRRPAVYAGLLAFGGMLGAAWIGSAPAAIWAVWGGSGAMLVWAAAATPVHGSRIDAQRWTWFTPRRTTPIDLGEIETVVIRTAPDGAGACRIHLRTGAQVEVPPICLPPAETLATVLAERGIPVIRH